MSRMDNDNSQLFICCKSALIKTNVFPCVHVCIIKSIPSYLCIKLSFAIWHINCYLPSFHFRKITIVSHFRLDRWPRAFDLFYTQICFCTLFLFSLHHILYFFFSFAIFILIKVLSKVIIRADKNRCF